MEFGATYHLENAQQFWAELDDIIACDPHSPLEIVDTAISSYISFARLYFDEYLKSDSELETLAYHLFHSQLFQDHADRLCLLLNNIMLTTSDPAIIYLILYLIFIRASTHRHVYRTLREIRLDPSLSSSSSSPSSSSSSHNNLISFLIYTLDTYADVTEGRPESNLGEQAARMLYEVCRLARLDDSELELITVKFIERLFDIVEGTRDQADEHFNYSVIRLIIALNEQYMVASLKNQKVSSTARNRTISAQFNTHHEDDVATLTNQDQDPNLVLNVIKNRGGRCKTFGENIIFILNRLDESQENLCVSLLILKLLYLLFTTPSTQEYFYTNDLCVLVDVFIRELTNLPEESEGLRNTYLRVLHPLLTNTQLKSHPYKRGAIRLTLLGLIQDPHQIRNVSPTTQRLVTRNLSADWCVELEISKGIQPGEWKEMLQKQAAKKKSAMYLTVNHDTISLPKRGQSTDDLTRTSTIATAGVGSNNDLPDRRGSTPPQPSATHPPPTSCISRSPLYHDSGSPSSTLPKRRPPPKPPVKSAPPTPPAHETLASQAPTTTRRAPPPPPSIRVDH